MLDVECPTLNKGVGDRNMRSRERDEIVRAESLTIHFDSCLGNIVSIDKSSSFPPPHGVGRGYVRKLRYYTYDLT